jgi:hypothetical protein
MVQAGSYPLNNWRMRVAKISVALAAVTHAQTPVDKCSGNGDCTREDTSGITRRGVCAPCNDLYRCQSTSCYTNQTAPPPEIDCNAKYKAAVCVVENRTQPPFGSYIVNHCEVATCQTSADCRPNGQCRQWLDPSYGNCELGFHCAYPSDTCRQDSDCPSDQICVWDGKKPSCVERPRPTPVPMPRCTGTKCCFYDECAAVQSDVPAPAP